ncbi:MAG TPA: HAD family hydrolase [Alloacidobacterium sp.]|nr:HAD family hydrolase [Alloacidobacterium sp.]
MGTLSRFAPGQTLLLDADDTLWENNIYFERAIAAFISYLNHHAYTREEVRAALNEVERETVRERGYGVSSFQHSLITCFERLSTEPITAEKHERIVSFSQSIHQQEIELLPGVAEVLPELASRHRLILMTKGNAEEQTDKLARSGLAQHFTSVEVPKEKNPDAYYSVCRKYELLQQTTWMIGNSPKSDINPALTAGLHAIFIRHPHTWCLEHETVDAAREGQHFLELESFQQLGRHF